MYKNAEELIKNEVPPEFERQIYYGIQNGLYVFKEFLVNNSYIFDSDLKNNILPRIMTFCIDKQFSPEVYVGKWEFHSRLQKINTFGYTIVELENQKMIINIAKIKKGHILPPIAKYKLKYAQNNEFEEGQLRFNLNNISNPIDDMPYYGIITYSVDDNLELQEVNLVIPSPDMKTYIKIIDVKDDFYKIKTLKSDLTNEKTLVTLKNEVKNEMKRLKMGEK